MIFSSMDFFIFFAALLLIYSQLKNTQQRSATLLVASLIFYASWQPVYLLLLGGSLFVNHRFYLLLLTKPRRSVLVLGLIFNLGILVFFKYMGMFYDTYTWLSTVLGISDHHAPTPSWAEWILPLGISFFTFQMLSALIDAWRNEWHRQVSFREWCLYVTFFPQLIAGPIVRPREIFDQLENLAPLNLHNLRLGTLIFIAGFIKKVIFSDNLAPLVEQLYAQPAQLDFTLSWLATLAFGMQIYLDFSGYSEMAVGLSLILGIQLPRNFLYPYISSNVSEFWTRWHISLSQWLRDYLYIPLGGSKGKLSRTYFNLMLTMLLGGLWHGASWTFVFWGALHGFYLVCFHGLDFCYRQWGVNHTPLYAAIIKRLGVIVTFIAITFSWVFFRADSFNSALDIVYAMLGAGAAASPLSVPLYQQALIGVTLALVFLEPRLVHWLHSRGLSLWFNVVHFSFRGLAYAAMVLFFIVFSGSTQKFIYFDF